MRTVKIPSFADLPIGKKLAVAFALTTTVALFLATVFFAYSTWQHEKDGAKAELAAVAELIGANSTAAIAFNDTAAAHEILASLKNVPGIVFGAIYDDDGRELARFDTGVDINPGSSDTNTELDLKVSSPIKLDDTALGTVVLYASLQPRIEALLDNTFTVAAASLTSLVLALLIAWRIQKSITRPIDGLTATMQHVSDHHNYSVRAPVMQNDEIGLLARGINDMLAKAEERDHVLESEVSKRTAELLDSNEKLKKELAERARMENGLKEAHQALERHHSEFSLLSEMNDRLQVCHAVAEMKPVVAHYARRLFPDCSGALYVYNNSRSLVEPVVVWGKPPPSEDVFRQDECWALRQGHPHKVDDAETGLICPHCADEISGPYICVPMIAYGDVLGILHLGVSADNASRGLSSGFEQLAISASEHLALALANLRLREALQAQSVRDPLTGLFNRRYMQETLERELARTERMETKLGVIMIDVDHFKAFNDTHGHEAGDLVLHELGAFLMRAIRSEDIACRYGGEEFIVIMPGIDEENASRRAEDLRQGVKQIRIQYKGENLCGLSISLGVALSPEHGNTASVLTDNADAALYKAKRAGRDQIVMASSDAPEIKHASNK